MAKKPQNFSLFLLITIICSIFILSTNITYQEFIAQGDHGRDMYCSYDTMNGAVPYRDYRWIYGPIMPYYYALSFKVLGPTIQSILISEVFIKLLSSIFIFLIISYFTNSFIALTASIYFSCFFGYFFYTYNHTGGIMLLLASVYFLFTFLMNKNIKALYFGLFCCLLIAFVKLNIGAAALFTYILSTFIIDKNFNYLGNNKKKFYLISLVLVPLAIFLVYLTLTWGLPKDSLKQCLPFFKNYRQLNAVTLPPLKSFVDIMFIKFSDKYNFFIIASSILSIFFLIFPINKKPIINLKNKFHTAFFILLIFLITNLHEFLVNGIYYRITWASPFLIIILFLIIGAAQNKTKNLIFKFLCIAIIISSILLIHKKTNNIALLKRRFNFIALDRAQLVIGNSPSWINTVENTCDFLKENLKDDESFFALPYDPLYYFLMNKKNPTRDTTLFEFVRITPEQQKKIIKNLEKNNINWILLSNTSKKSGRAGLGILGTTHCKILFKYIMDNYEPVKTYGPWEKEAGWTLNHSMRILKKKTQQKNDK